MFAKILSIAAFIGMTMANLHMESVHHAPQPYKFGYDIKDHHGQQYREESGNGAGGVQGSYGFTDARGIKRRVNYVADHAGFRAVVKTNEPGTANQNPAAVNMISDAPYQGGIALNGLGGGLGISSLGLGGFGVAGPGLGGVGVTGRGLGGLGVAGRGLGGLGVPGLSLGWLGTAGLGNLGYGNGAIRNGLGYSIGGLNYGVPSLGYARYGY